MDDKIAAWAQAFARLGNRFISSRGFHPPTVTAANEMRNPCPGTVAPVIIVGGGAIGLFLAIKLGRLNIPVTVIERRTGEFPHSLGIGITPLALEALSQEGLAPEVIQAGLKVNDVSVHSDRRCLGLVNFDSIIPGSFILSLPQKKTVAILESHLSRYPSICYRKGWQVEDFTETPSAVTVTIKNVETSLYERLSGSFIVGADGAKSRVRELAEIPLRLYPHETLWFKLADFRETTPQNAQASLYFTSKGSVESFPLPDGLRRWIVQCPPPSQAKEADKSFVDLVATMTGLQLNSADQLSEFQFSPDRYIAQTGWKGRTVLCGDAAHLMSPVGGQGMNVGLVDAAWLADIFARILIDGNDADTLRPVYDYYRAQCWEVSGRRSEYFMRLGTLKGKGKSLLREYAIKHLMLKSPFKKLMIFHFMMRTLPYSFPNEVLPPRIPVEHTTASY